MKNEAVMSIAHKGVASDVLIELPKPPVYLSDEAKGHFKKWGEKLIKAKVLKDHHLAALEILAQEMGTFEWACREIKTQNKIKHGKGYIQKYQSGAKQISAEITLKEKAQKTILQCLKQFGMDPRSEKELKSNTDPNQTSLVDEFKKALSGN